MNEGRSDVIKEHASEMKMRFFGRERSFVLSRSWVLNVEGNRPIEGTLH
jgi:hypothetical protein